MAQPNLALRTTGNGLFSHYVVAGSKNPFALAVGSVKDKIVNSVDILTRKEYQTYEEYLIEIKDNLIACNVKMADIKNNMDISRIPKPTEKDYERLKKYEEALKILQE